MKFRLVEEDQFDNWEYDANAPLNLDVKPINESFISDLGNADKTLKDLSELAEFLGIHTLADLDRFNRENNPERKPLYDALLDYRMQLGDTFEGSKNGCVETSPVIDDDFNIDESFSPEDIYSRLMIESEKPATPSLNVSEGVSPSSTNEIVADASFTSYDDEI